MNKQRARSGEAEQRSRASTRDVSAPRRGGERSGRGPGGPTRAQLCDEAKRRGVPGRSQMSKDELQRALAR